MLINETQTAGILVAATLVFLAGFWILPGGVLALRRRARGEIQVDVRVGYRPATLYRLLDLYGPGGIRSFRRMLRTDMIFPAIYGALFFVLGDLLNPVRPTTLSAAALVRVVGVAAAVFDYAENTFLFFILRNLPRQRLSAARCAGLCTSAKTASLVVAMGALVAAITRR